MESQTRLGVWGYSAKILIVGLPIEPTLSASKETAYGNGNEDQRGTDSLRRRFTHEW